MSLKIRLARGGSKKRPFYSIVVADARAPRDGRFIEKIGAYNPLLPKDSEQRVVLDVEKVREWLAKGAQPTDRVARFLSHAGLVKWEHGNNPQKAEPGQKAKERVKEREQKLEARIKAEEEARAAAEAARNAPPPEEPAEVAESAAAE